MQQAPKSSLTQAIKQEALKKEVTDKLLTTFNQDMAPIQVMGHQTSETSKLATEMANIVIQSPEQKFEGSIFAGTYMD